MATIKQMKARMNSGHLTVLRRIAESGQYGCTTDRTSEIRGFQKCHQTLSRWGAVDGNSLTDIGKELLGQ